MMLFATISLATVVQASFFNPNPRGFYTSPQLAEKGCADKGGSVANVNMRGLDKFIQKDKFLKRKKFFLLKSEAEGPTSYVDKNLSRVRPKKKAPTICYFAPSAERTQYSCATAGAKDEYPEHYAFFNAEAAKTVDWESARAECQKMGGQWDLAIINNNEEFDYINNVIEKECWSDQAFWIGMKEFDTIDNGDGTYSEGRVETMFGRIPDWKIEWDSDEPNNNLGDEQCLRVKDKKVNDAICSRTWTGPSNDGIGMGFVCENHNYYESCKAETMDQYSANYAINFGGQKPWDEAREECLAKGDGWDLAVPNSAEEMEYLSNLANCDDGGFWLGVKWTPDSDAAEFNSAGSLWAVDGSDELFIPWDKHTNWDTPNPNSKLSNRVTECIRMRGNLVVDSMCDKTSGPSKRPYPQPWGWICEYTPPSCTVDQDADPLEDGEYVIRHDEGVNFNNARKACRDLGKEWDLAIFNHNREFNRILDILEAHCVNDFAYWIGYKEFDGVAETVFGQALRSKADGFTTSIPLPWDTESNPTAPEPNDWLGDEECVRLRNGKMNDAICSRTWAGVKKDGIGMGYICERHHPCEDKRSGTSFTGYKGPDYIIEPPTHISANDAKAACKAEGEGWDLAIIDGAGELKEINEKITDGCAPYWTGMRERSGILYDLDGTTQIAYANWDSHLGHGFSPEPDLGPGEECVRMRGGWYNDADCDDNTGFTKEEGMGYICEYKTPTPTPPPDDDDEQCLPCRHNPGVLPWTTQPGCVEPSCGAKLGIVDAWKIGNGVDRPVRYGFIGLIKLPEEVVDGNEEFSVLIRFSKRVTHGHFQLWNMKFWNFYNGGYEVLIHSKFWNTDRHDKYSVGFVAEELNAEEYPELLFWSGRQKHHPCFQPSMHHSGKMRSGDAVTAYDKAVEEKPEIDPEDVTSVKWRKGKIVYVRGQKKKQNKSKLR